MRKSLTLTLLAILLMSLGSTPYAQQRVAKAEGPLVKAEKPKAEASFAQANQEISKVSGKLGADPKYSSRFLEAARAKDKTTLERMLRESGVRSEFKLDVKSKGGGSDQSTDFQIQICIGALISICFSWDVPVT